MNARDHWVQQAAGRVFARSWQPDEADHEGLAPIVMFHDSLGSVELWRQFPELLCRGTGRRVFAFDRLGFGKSDARSDRLSAGFVAEEARIYFPQLRRQLGIDRFIALGHSVGGAMAIECAAQFPDGCEALVTIAAQVFAEETTLGGIRAAREQFADPVQFDRLARYHGDKTRWVLDAWIDSWLDPAFADWNLRSVLPNVVCPALAIHGNTDEYGTTIHPKIIAELSGGSVRPVIMAGVGHLPHREQPDAVVALIGDFARALHHP